jgi:hypothetical protein
MSGLLLGLALLAFVQCRNRSTPDYFPLASGRTWSYSLNEDMELCKSQLRVVEASGDRFTLRESAESPDVWVSFPFWCDEDFPVARTDSGIVCLHDTPWLLLKLPLEVGDGWNYGEDSAFVFDKATVSVPAGEFEDCFRVGYRWCCCGETYFDYIWYAPNVGMVRIDDEGNVTTSALISANF